MSEAPREFLSVDDIKERIRSRVRDAVNSAAPGYGTPVSLQKESAALALHRFNELRLKLQHANSALNDVGNVNPRPAGWNNELAQLVKKCIRRALSWLLRPIQQFDSTVMASLSETTHVLEDFQTELRSLAGRIEALEATLRDSHATPIRLSGNGANGGGSQIDIAAQIELLQSQIEALAKDVRDLKGRRTATG
jgi:hypothetical protein